jgi:UDP-N-acetylglucosamine--N-acetylmuramyl-(pentapeptide) pyrophosphoryl-undecaprenol N-acetylglucosamine transferase
MPTAYSAADLVISRSGASSLSEIAVMGKPSILIPLVIASNNEQEYNAKYFEKKGAAVIFNQNSLEVAFAQRVLDLLFNTNKLIDMQMQAKFFAKPNAANFIANTILENLSSRK